MSSPARASMADIVAVDRQIRQLAQRIKQLRRLDASDPAPVEDDESRRRRAYRERYRMLPLEVRLWVTSQVDACPICGRDEQLTVDHIVPPALGGTDHDSNLWTLCRSCNTKKGQRTRSTFVAALILDLLGRARTLRRQLKAMEATRCTNDC